MQVRFATADDITLIHSLIGELAKYERLLDRFIGTEEALREHLFGPRPYCEVVIAEDDQGPAGFALFFHNYSTFLTKPGIYLEDLFVRPERRGAGVGKALLEHLARIALKRGCGRLEWSVLDWNEPVIRFYRRLGGTLLDEWTICRLEGQALQTLAGGSSERKA